MFLWITDRLSSTNRSVSQLDSIGKPVLSVRWAGGEIDRMDESGDSIAKLIDGSEEL